VNVVLPLNIKNAKCGQVVGETEQSLSRGPADLESDGHGKIVCLGKGNPELKTRCGLAWLIDAHVLSQNWNLNGGTDLYQLGQITEDAR